MNQTPNPEQIGMAAGLYRLLKDIASAGSVTWTAGELKEMIEKATRF